MQPTLVGVSLEAWLTMAAIIIGPAVALALQRYSERRREAKLRRLNVFKELMATRAPSARVSQRHVDALNAIEIEFSSAKGADKKVFEAWRLYLDLLNDQSVDANDKDAVARWSDKGNDLLIELLFEMSVAVGFSFDKVWLKKSVYYPKAHGELELDQYLFRKFFLDVVVGRRAMWTGVMTGEKPLQMEIVNLPQPPTIEGSVVGSPEGR